MSQSDITDDHEPIGPTPRASSATGSSEPTNDAPTHALIHVPNLLLPHSRLAVSSLREMPTHNGVAWVADLTIDGRLAGSIENDGNAGPTSYFGLNSSPFNYRDLFDYVRACRHQGRIPTQEVVLDALVDEYDLSQQVADAAAANGTLARLLDEDGFTLQTHLVQAVPITQVEWAAIAEHVQDLPQSLPGGKVWQLWTGSAWCHLTDTQPQAIRP